MDGYNLQIVWYIWLQAPFYFMENREGKTYRIKAGQFKDSEYIVEALWDKLTGKSWMVSDGNPAALEYAMRSGLEGDNHYDDNVWYGHLRESGMGKLIHETQIGEEVVRK